MRLPQLMDSALEAVRRAASITVLYVNVRCLNVAYVDASYAAILDRADLVYCDGTGVRLGARLVGLPIPQRMTGADWIHDLCRLAVRENVSLFLFGSERGVAAGAARVLTYTHPGLRVAGAMDGYRRGRDVVEAINRSDADIVLVGMGTPTQEEWIADHREQLKAPVVWAVGALFDFASGRLPRGPRWMTDHGLEWVCRLVVEPRKLWRRYLIGNPLFAWRVVRRYWI